MAAITTVNATSSLQRTVELVEHAVSGREQQRQQIGFQAHHQNLRFGIAEAGVVFDQLWPVAVIIRPANSTPLNGVPRSSMPATVGRMISAIVRSIISGVMTGAGE